MKKFNVSPKPLRTCLFLKRFQLSNIQNSCEPSKLDYRSYCLDYHEAGPAHMYSRYVPSVTVFCVGCACVFVYSQWWVLHAFHLCLGLSFFDPQTWMGYFASLNL